MKKVLVFLAIVMIASFVGAQTLTWMGDSYAYSVDNDEWYRGSGPANGGWANLSLTIFDDMDFGIVSTLNLGGQVMTYWDDNATHPSTTVTMEYQVDATPQSNLALGWNSFASNNDKWEDMTGVDVIAASGVGAGSHTVAIWFQAAEAGQTTIFDNNGGANFVADFQTAAVPEPATMTLLGLGALAMVLRRKMRK